MFSKDFVWGAATAAYQIEGAWDQDGKGESIWDRFSHTSPRMQNTGDVACDHYNRLEEDVTLMKNLGLKSYRFSFSWTRIFPNGIGEPNQKGIDFYKKLVRLLEEANIMPFATLYHWDLPQALQDTGGWREKCTVEAFKEYAKFMFNEFPSINHWITFNEPFVVSVLGHGTGTIAPGITDLKLAYQVSHHLNLAHAHAIKEYRKSGLNGKIGAAISLVTCYPESDNPKTIEASQMIDIGKNRWYLDPMLKGKYPDGALKMMQQMLGAPDVTEDELKFMEDNLPDFVGVNLYTRFLIKDGTDPMTFKPDNLSAREIESNENYTNMGWEIYPDALKDMLLILRNEYGNPEIYITENGASFKEPNEATYIEDDNRIEFLNKYINAVKEAISEGVNVKGYFVWTLMDNLEWAEGFSQRFGLIHIDFNTLKRTPKKSYYSYKRIIENNGII